MNAFLDEKNILSLPARLILVAGVVVGKLRLGDTKKRNCSVNDTNDECSYLIC
jgi:hypothetical protein